MLAGIGVDLTPVEVSPSPLRQDPDRICDLVTALTGGIARSEYSTWLSGTEVDMTPPGQSAAVIVVADARAPA